MSVDKSVMKYAKLWRGRINFEGVSKLIES